MSNIAELKREYANLELNNTERNKLKQLLSKTKLADLLKLQKANVRNISELAQLEIFNRISKDASIKKDLQKLKSITGNNDFEARKKFEQYWQGIIYSIMRKYELPETKARIILKEKYERKNPSLVQCKKLIEKEKDKYYKPTISHYRDMENPSFTKAEKYVSSLRHKEKRRYASLYLQSRVLGLSYREFESRLPKSIVLSEMGKQAVRMNIDDILKKGNPKLTTKAKNSPMSSIIRDDKLKLARLERELKNTPRNEKGKRERLKTSIAMVKESIKYYEKAFARNAANTATVKNPKFSTKELRLIVSAHNEVNKTNFALAERDASKSRANLNKYDLFNGLNKVLIGATPQGVLKFLEQDFNKRNKKNGKTPKTKNFTNADFQRHLKETVRQNNIMFGGEYKGEKVKGLASDLTPKHGNTPLGTLVLLKVKRNGITIPIQFDGNSQLWMDLRRNLWAVGSDTRLANKDLKHFGITHRANGQLTPIGKLTQIDYIKAKKHLNGGELTHWYHKAGEVNRDVPLLYVDKDNFPIIVGGGYDVWKEGIVN